MNPVLLIFQCFLTVVSRQPQRQSPSLAIIVCSRICLPCSSVLSGAPVSCMTPHHFLDSTPHACGKPAQAAGPTDVASCAAAALPSSTVNLSAAPYFQDRVSTVSDQPAQQQVQQMLPAMQQQA